MNIQERIHPRRLFELPEKVKQYIPLADLREFVKAIPKSNKPFAPGYYYSEDGDFFTIVWKSERHYAQDDGEITLLKAFDTNEVVGIKIYGIFSKIGLVEITDDKAAE